MKRKAALFCALLSLLVFVPGCGDGGTADDAPKGGAKRPAPDTQRQAPGSGLSENQNQGATPPAGQ